jgi:leucyl/phenylalanyl-tRNA--protein transferase
MSGSSKPPSGSLFERLIFQPGEDIVAVGARLDPDVVFDAYRHGVFPWYDRDMPVLWWSPDPRALLPLDERFHVSRRLERTLRAGRFEVRHDVDFEGVMRGCDERRPDGTWIHADMLACYTELFRRGHAHSVEVVREGRLLGGVYGVAFGAGFAAESMFHRERDMSKVALVHLVRHLGARGFAFLDVQFPTPHLRRFGCFTVPRDAYLRMVADAVRQDVAFQ